MLKSCKYCGRIHDSKVDCGRKPVYKNNRKQEELIRYTTPMKKKSEEIKRSAKYLCENCLENKILNYTELETHHIIKLQERPDLALESLNLVSLCRNCHEKAEKGEISVSFLMKIAKKREKTPPPPL